jgi:muramoyltetrapeptide carboxypeptidase
VKRAAWLILLYPCFSLELANGQEATPIHPPALTWGDTIAIVAPAGGVERPRIELARRRLEEMGFNVRLPDNLYRRRGYLAGEDRERAEELMAAFRDRTVNAIFCGAGGYGTTRILHLLDYDVIQANPKILTGFSDITALHLAIQRNTGLITFHSPVAMYGLGSPNNLSAFSAEYFWRALLFQNYLDLDGRPLPPGYAYELPSDARVRVMTPGIARGRLTGGNLSLVCPLMGTPYEIETDGRILFLEDRNEETYRIDRYLSQLRLAGKLNGLAGVILGMFTDCEPRNPAGSLSLDQVFRDYFEPLGVPVILNFPAGHTRNNATLPLGALVELNAEPGKPGVTVLENPVRLLDPDEP